MNSSSSIVGVPALDLNTGQVVTDHAGAMPIPLAQFGGEKVVENGKAIIVFYPGLRIEIDVVHVGDLRCVFVVQEVRKPTANYVQGDEAIIWAAATQANAGAGPTAYPDADIIDYGERERFHAAGNRTPALDMDQEAIVTDYDFALPVPLRCTPHRKISDTQVEVFCDHGKWVAVDLCDHQGEPSVRIVQATEELLKPSRYTKDDIEILYATTAAKLLFTSENTPRGKKANPRNKLRRSAQR